MQNIKVFLSGNIHPAAQEKLADSVQLIVGDKNMGREAFLEAMRDVDAILSKDDPAPLDESLFAHTPKLRYISRHGTAYASIDVEAARLRGIPVSNTGGVNAVSVAECVFALILHMARHLSLALSPEGCNVPRGELMGMELCGKTLGVVGVGNVGREVVSRARAFGMNVLVYHPRPSAAELGKLGITSEQIVGLESLLRESDIVTLHAPANEETRGMLGAAQFAGMKRGALLVNAARPALVDEAAAVHALSNGVLAGMAVDYTPSTDSLLRGRADVVIAPHIGTMTRETQYRVGMTAVDNILRFFSGETPLYLL